MRRFLFPVIFLLSFYFLSAQEFEQKLPEDHPNYRTFPAALLLEAAAYAGTYCWQPDWPVDFPPDAFRPPSDDWTLITVNYRENSFCLRRDNGQLVEFPWFFEDILTQIRLEYSLPDKNKEILLKRAELGDFASIEVLEFSENNPYLLRIFWDEIYYFVYLGRITGEITESWFDKDGNFIEQYEYGFLPGDPRERIRSYRTFSANEYRRSFDSRFLITGIFGKNEEYTVDYYKEYFPRYLKRKVNDTDSGNYSFQWDNNDLLVRLTGEQDASRFLDSRYEYVFDERGNWIERREIRMIHGYSRIGADLSGEVTDNEGRRLLVPAPGTTFTRVLEYKNPE